MKNHILHPERDALLNQMIAKVRKLEKRVLNNNKRGTRVYYGSGKKFLTATKALDMAQRIHAVDARQVDIEGIIAEFQKDLCEVLGADRAELNTSEVFELADKLSPVVMDYHSEKFPTPKGKKGAVLLLSRGRGSSLAGPESCVERDISIPFEWFGGTYREGLSIIGHPDVMKFLKDFGHGRSPYDENGILLPFVGDTVYCAGIFYGTWEVQCK